MNTLWTIDELAVLVEKALETAPYAGQISGRVRSVPDLRTIRYYTTLGILDAPAEMRGRKAYYGRRHLMQLVAIKRRQAAGDSLQQIQKQLVARSDQELQGLAELPDRFWEGAEEFLVAAAAVQKAEPVVGISEPESSAPRRSYSSTPFWAKRGVVSRKESSPAHFDVSAALRVNLASGDGLMLEGIAPDGLSPEAVADLKSIAERLAAELHHWRRKHLGSQP